MSALAACLSVVAVAGCHRATAAEREQARLRLPRDAARFSISSANDSAVTFRPFEANWIRSGMRGIVVDPTQRDALIARLTIQQRDTAGVVATINGSVAQVSTTHVVLMVQPAVAWWKDKRFWIGVASGGILASVAANNSK